MVRLFLFFTLFCSNYLVAQEMTVISVGEAELERDKLYMGRPVLTDNFASVQVSAIDEFVALVQNDFSFYKKRFEVIKGSDAITSSPDYSSLKEKKIHYAIGMSFRRSVEKVYYELSLFEIAKDIKLHTESGELPLVGVRKEGHRASDLLYQKITGKQSIFNSQIFFVSDRTKTKKQIYKELYSVDFDGKNVKRLTNHNGVVISPSISFDRKRVLYSMIKDSDGRRRNINLFILDLETGRTELISSLKGLNTGAIFLPDDEHIVFTVSHSGNAEIVKMNLKTKVMSPITKHPAEDVDPSFNSDGTLMTFLSSRAGRAMIYTMDPRGQEKDVKRISFVGKFNSSPRFNPEGSEIAFASWVDERFDIYRIGADGQNLVRLTKDFGSNEDPSFSPDGQFLIFSSKRYLSVYESVQNLYVMDRDGEIIGPITQNFGNCLTPRWSNY